MFRRLPLLTTVCLLVAAGVARSTTVIPPSFDQLVAEAQTVFVGEVMNVRAEWEATPSGRAIVTMVTFRVEDVWKGNLGAVTQLEFLGGEIGEIGMKVEGMPVFRLGQRDVLFVGSAVRTVSPLVGFMHGRMRVERDTVSGIDRVRTFDGRACARRREAAMNRRRTVCGAIVVLVFCVTTMESPRGFSLLANKWPNGTVTMHLQLGSGSGTLIDGSTSWNQVATTALATWNTNLDLVKFSAVNDSTVSRGDGTGANNVFFDSAVYGRSFGNSTLAIATSWYNTRTNDKIEGDVVFNSTKSWNSYRGNLRSGANDFYRVALHEFGHILGLDHPDENGQDVNAQMNSIIGNLDALASDDIAGARSLYGAGVTSNISFPPRNEPADFYNQLIAVYQNDLRAAQVTTYVDPEGAVIWLTEYARYRVGLCDHSTAQTRTFSAIDNTGVFGVCALTPSGTIPFPPRNEGLNFMNALQVKYRDDLRRGAGSSFVDNEGAVVWVLEYLRYRLNSCSHGDATTKVFMQIRGQGIQPVCR